MIDLLLEMKKELKLIENIQEKEELPFAEIEYNGHSFKTGKSVTFPYLRNTVSSKKHVKTGYQQEIEPSGRYLNFDDFPEKEPNKGWEKGEVTLHNPLVLEWGNSYDTSSWKKALFNKYKKTGNKLTQTLIKDGYDAVITIDGKDLSEIVVFGKASVKVLKPQEAIDSIRNWD